jgi:hypothetical protein
MFGSDGEAYKNQYEQLALTPKRYAKDGIIRLPFGLDLGPVINRNGLGWRYLPGHFDGNSFSANVQPTQLSITTLQTWTNGAHHGTNTILTNASSYKIGNVTGTLPQTITGCAYGMMGAWMTTNTSVVKFDPGVGVNRTTNLDGLNKARDPVEYNGYLFFSAQRVSSGFPVVGYITPQIFPDPNRPVVPHYFSIEHLGKNGVVGVYKGQVVVATQKGVWTVSPLSDGNHYGLGGQIFDWNLSDNCKICVGFFGVFALDNGSLYIFSDNPRIEHNTRFTAIASSGPKVVLSGASDIAISDGDGFVGLSGYTVIGTVLKAGANLFVPEWAPNTNPASVVLETTNAHFASYMEVGQVLAHESVSAISLITDYKTFVLRKSVTNLSQWRAGYSARNLIIRMTVPANTQITAPILYMRPRSSL